ncbi:beta-glucosidase [Granulicella mallensis]|uniref:Beta-glucosidase n=1 Tax=Granulicella mallensis (strain ATCC BAA-1857 / DSM 23137 / MP5ACTX8) TaxID=682795 RepID=G8NYD2_GRAMM|nr:glycoside hydrolase family 3 C-terminal domain-containing protein [Granulicella mallensis]AEU37898.1 Beta-glucosidase [Granulicella mallensis MP5ACTX8]
MLLPLRKLFTIALLLATPGINAQKAKAPAAPKPWMDTSLSPDQRADLVLAQLTLAEKIQLVHGIGWGPLRAGESVPADNNGGAGEVVGIPRLGIPSLQQADSAVGVRMAAPQSRYATLLPSVLGAAASWDSEAAHLYGDVIGRELRAQGYNQSIGGGVNLARDPRNGRLFEYPGEDPLLAGVTVGHVIQGVQANGVMGDIKHFALNDQETGRTVVDVHMPHKAARESDLLAFEIGIRIGQPASVMCSYNKVDGDWACENEWLLSHVLKQDWKYPGFVVSDWEATHTTVKAALAGLDMQMPGDEHFGKPLEQAVTSGQVPMARLDNMVHRLLRSMFAAGVIDRPPTPRTVVDPFRGRDDAQHIAEESIVLLKNNGTLPLNPQNLHSIAVIGAHADRGIMSGGGSAQVDAPGGNALDPSRPSKWGEPVYFPSAPLRYIREHVPDATVRFDPGTDPASAARLAKSADVAIVFADQYMSEGGDAPTLSLPNNQDALIRAVAAANPHTVVILITGNPVSMPWVNQVAGILEAWYPGIAGGQAIANLLFGSVNPSGKLPITFAKSEADLPHARIFGMSYQIANGGLPEHWISENKRESFPANYTEGVRFGYKWFDSEDKEPLFAFGYGLSYTTYSYTGLKVNAAGHAVTFTLTNTGKRDGTEISQVYVQLPLASGENFRRLAGWQRVSLKAGENKTVTITLEPLAFASFSEQKDAWQWLDGEYVVSVGGSSRSRPLERKTSLR